MDGLRRLRADMAAAPAAGSDPVAGRPRGRRRLRRWPRRLLIVANVVVALSLIGTASAYGYVQWRLGQIKKIPILGLTPAGKGQSQVPPGGSIAPFTMLLIGSDTRNLKGSNNSQFGTSTQVQGQRSDSIILVRVRPDTRSLALLSIPRDTLVPIPGIGVTRVNTAFNSGNPGLLVKVLDQDFGIQVNHVAEFNFDTFEAIANAIGGVSVWFPTPAKDTFSNLGVPKGCVVLKGRQALAFARSREYQYFLDGSWHFQQAPESDIARIQRQQAFVRLAVKKAEQVAPTNPVALNNVIAGLTKNVTLDSHFSNSLILELAKDFHSAGLSGVPSYTYPTVNSASVPGALDPQVAAGRTMIHEWLNTGQPLTPDAPHGSSTTSPPTTTVKPASVSVEVANGSGVTGQATAAASALSALGYHTTVNPGAASAPAGTVVRYAPDALAAARQVKAQLRGGASLVRDPGLTPTPYNLEVVTGPGYTGVKGAASATAPSAASATPPTTAVTASAATVSANPETSAAPPPGGTTPNSQINPSSSSFYHYQYIPPGRVPGQTPQACGS